MLLFIVFFTCTVLAQDAGSLRRNYKPTIPEKIQKLVLDPLPAGTYSIGSGGYFPTIDSAFNKLSIDGIAGEVVLELTDAQYIAPAGSSFILNGPINGASSSSRVTIRPADNVAVTINGDGEAVLLFYDVSYLTIDGISLQGSTGLKVHAFYNSTGTQWNDAIDFFGNCDYVQVKNLTASSDDVNRFSGAILFQFYNQSKPDNGLISGVFIPVVNIGIYLIGNGTLNPTNFVISNNHIGSPSDSLIVNGIENENADGTIIEYNHIENIRKGFFSSGIYYVEAINSYVSDNVIIRNNVIHNIAATNSNTRAQGIFISAGSGMGENNWIYNNIVYDIRTYVPNIHWLAGIFVHNLNPKVDYNTVWLPEVNDAAPTPGSSALYIYPGTTTPTIRDNILINTRNDEPYTAVAAKYAVADVSDYNDLYVSQFDHSYVGSLGGTFYKTLSDWQTTGKDLNSISEMPHFISSTDLHIDKTYPTNLERGATPIAGITTDFDGDTRNATTPDIGGDEFDGFTFEDPLPAGTYTVGTGGNFETIQHCFDVLSQYGIAGNVTLELIDELYTAPTDSFGFKLNGPIPGAGPNSRITIKPAENKNVTIEGNGQIILNFINTSYLTLDGVGLTGSTTLTIHSLSSGAFDFTICSAFQNNSDHNVVQNIVFLSENYTKNGFGPSFWTRIGLTVTADSNLIQNNFIKKAGCGIYVSSYNSSLRAEGNIIRGNYIGSDVDSLIAWGIQVEHGHNTIIENNIVQNLKVTTSIGEILIPGINSYWGNGDIIRNNVVHSLKASGGYTSVGILLSGEGSWYGSNNMVYNNMVYDIQSTSTQGDSRVAGIQVWMQQNPKIYYNSVYLSGTGANHYGSGALYIWNTCSNVEAKDNILVNTRDESSYCASSIYIQGSNSILATSDYNDLYYDNSNPHNCLVRASSDYLTLADWQATGKDLHSYFEMPHFIEPYLHINDTIPTYIEARGIPITGIDTDFDGDPRNSTNPDLGADELDGIVGVEDEETIPTEFALEQNYPNPFNPSTTFRYSIQTQSKVVIKVFDILGNEIATLMDEEKSVGTYELTWNAANLPSGVYFYQLKAGSFVETKKMLLLK
jgi:hypothetical protein